MGALIIKFDNLSPISVSAKIDLSEFYMTDKESFLNVLKENLNDTNILPEESFSVVL